MKNDTSPVMIPAVAGPNESAILKCGLRPTNAESADKPSVWKYEEHGWKASKNLQGRPKTEMLTAFGLDEMMAKETLSKAPLVHRLEKSGVCESPKRGRYISVAADYPTPAPHKGRFNAQRFRPLKNDIIIKRGSP